MNASPTQVDTSTTPALVRRSGAPVPGAPGRRSTLLRHLTVAAVIGVLLLIATYELDSFRNYQLATAAAYLCTTAGLTVLIGLNGQISLGHGALMAVGAYTVALLQNYFSEHDILGQWLLLVSLLAGVVAALLAGAVIGVAAARLRGPYLAGATLAVAVVVPAITTTFNSLFNGDQGLSVYVEPPPAALGFDFPYERWQAWLALLGALLVFLLLANLIRSRFGRSLRAVRDDEVAAQLAGIHVARTQIMAFVVSAACAGLGGGLLAVLAQSVNPSTFSLTLSLYLLLAVVVGGLGSLAGAIWGSVAIVVLPQLINSFTDSLSLSPAASQRLEGNLSLAIFGLTLVIVMIAAPGGIQGLVRRAAGPVRAMWRGRPDKPGG
jgi:ABC-type branched-subunit amino acid transport system permease subunit